jgi:hypothetical protein
MNRRALAAGGLTGLVAVGAAAASDPLFADVQAFVATLPRGPQVLAYGDGAHTRAYWDSVTVPAFAFVGDALTPQVAA